MAWHDWVRKLIHWELCKKLKFDHNTKWYMHRLESVLENEIHKTLRFWDTNRSPNPSHTNNHHHVVLVARISLTLSRHFSLSFIASGRSSGLHPVSSHSCWMYVRAGCPAFARPYVAVHKSKSLMSSSLLLQ